MRRKKIYLNIIIGVYIIIITLKGIEGKSIIVTLSNKYIYKDTAAILMKIQSIDSNYSDLFKLSPYLVKLPKKFNNTFLHKNLSIESFNYSNDNMIPIIELIDCTNNFIKKWHIKNNNILKLPTFTTERRDNYLKYNCKNIFSKIIDQKFKSESQKIYKISYEEDLIELYNDQNRNLRYNLENKYLDLLRIFITTLLIRCRNEDPLIYLWKRKMLLHMKFILIYTDKCIEYTKLSTSSKNIELEENILMFYSIISIALQGDKSKSLIQVQTLEDIFSIYFFYGLYFKIKDNKFENINGKCLLSNYEQERFDLDNRNIIICKESVFKIGIMILYCNFIKNVKLIDKILKKNILNEIYNEIRYENCKIIYKPEYYDLIKNLCNIIINGRILKNEIKDFELDILDIGKSEYNRPIKLPDLSYKNYIRNNNIKNININNFIDWSINFYIKALIDKNFSGIKFILEKIMTIDRNDFIRDICPIAGYILFIFNYNSGFNDIDYLVISNNDNKLLDIIKEKEVVIPTRFYVYLQDIIDLNIVSWILLIITIILTKILFNIIYIIIISMYKNF